MRVSITLKPRSEILQRCQVLINHGTFERDVFGDDEGISSFPTARGNWKAKWEETTVRRARGRQQDFLSRRSEDPPSSFR